MIKKNELVRIREELKEVARRIDSFTDETSQKIENVAIKLNETGLLLSNIQANMLCNEIRKSCDKMCDTLDRIDKMEDTLDEDELEM